MLVGRVDPFQAVDLIERSIRGENRVDSAVDCEGREDGVASAELVVRLEQVDPALDVMWLHGMPPGERGDTSGGFRRAEAIPRPARSLVRELLKEIRACLALQVAARRPPHDLAARRLVWMLSTERVDED